MYAYPMRCWTAGKLDRGGRGWGLGFVVLWGFLVDLWGFGGFMGFLAQLLCAGQFWRWQHRACVWLVFVVEVVVVVFGVLCAALVVISGLVLVVNDIHS